jgi:hypothetical protein
MSIEAIKKKQVQEVRQLRPINRARIIQYVVVSALFVTFVSYLPDANRQSRSAEIVAERVATKEGIALTVQTSSEWLVSHGYQFEVSLFEFIGVSLLSRIEQLDADSFIFTPYAYVIGGLVRVSFFLIASFRFLLICILWGIFSSTKTFRPYIGRDLLGETGIGKLFYSGIRASLDEVTDEGEPAQLVTNLATLKRVSIETARSSKLTSLLSSHQALNDTTLELVQHILAYPNHPFFAPAGDEEFSASDISLIDGTYQLLSSHFVQNTFSSVLMPFQEGASQIHPCEFAALMLSIQAGKAMGYLKEGNHWVRRSSFINLNARSVLHSIPSYKDDFTSLERQSIRQSLVYARRYSSFGPVRLPQEMDHKTRALRQVAEVLLAAPQNVQTVAAEVELYGRSFKAYQLFENKFFKRIESYDQDLLQSIIATESGLICVHVKSIVDICSEVISQEELDRLSDLISLVSQTQKVIDLKDEMKDGEATKGSLPTFQRIFLPIPFVRIKQIADDFLVSQEIIQRWSISRNIFNSFGWITRQVGTTIVPEESCGYIVFRGAEWSKEANSLGLLGKTGMIPFRSTAFELRLGKNWRSRFAVAESASIAEDKAYFEKLLTGYDPLHSEDEEEDSRGT